MQIHPCETACRLNISSTGGADLIRGLLMIICYLSSCVEHYIKINRQLAEENLELKVKLHKIGRVFAPKNEQSAESDEHNSQKPKRKRGAQPGRKPRSRNIPDQLPKQEVEVDLTDTPCCSVCGKQYKSESALDNISHQISTTISAVHQIITRRTYKKDCACPGDKTIITAPQRKSLIKNPFWPPRPGFI